MKTPPLDPEKNLIPEIPEQPTATPVAQVDDADLKEIRGEMGQNLQAAMVAVERDAGVEKLSQKKRAICVLGLPGAGKTTQIEELHNALGAPVFHVGKLAKAIGKRDEERRKRGELLEGLNEEFMERVKAAPNENVILDGFPRSPEQAELLLVTAQREGWEVEVIHLAFPEGQEVETSYHRQSSRAHLAGEELDEARFRGKIQRALTMDMAALATVREKGGKILDVDATQPRTNVTTKIRESLDLDFESLPWERQTLAIVEKISEQTGVEMWLSAGSLYRAFWNGKFGPFQESTDKDVFIEREEDIEKVEKALAEAAPEVRWAVHSRVQETANHYGLPVESLQKGIVDVPLNFRQGAVRMNQGKVEVLLAPEVEADLRHGILRFDEKVLAKLPADAVEKTFRDAPSRVKKTLEEYPGLRLEGKLAELYAEKYGAHTSQPVEGDWEAIEKAVIEREYGGHSHWRSETLTDREIQIAGEVADFYRTIVKVPSAPPRPKKAKLPGVLETIRDLRTRDQKGDALNDSERAMLDNQKETVPEGYESWLHYVATESSDDEFREWLLNQIRSRSPVGGVDDYLKKAFDYAKSGRNQKQKETHMAFPLHKHLQEAMLQLSTDELLKSLEAQGVPPEQRKTIRRDMRIAMLWHDMGKLHNIYTPGSHEAIGAKLWQRQKPDWISDEEGKLIDWMIRTHDISGRLLRGITEKKDHKLMDVGFDVSAEPSYKGALDPQGVREELLKSGFDLPTATALHLAIWKGDVASVAALRWLLPVVEKVEQIILA